MAVDTLFNDVRLLLQSGSLTNAATSSPASVSSSGVTGGSALTFSSTGVVTATSVVLASSPTLATLELVVTPTWAEYSKIASMLGLSLNAISPGVIGIYSFASATPSLVGSLTTAQSGEITLIAEYSVSGANIEIKLTAIPPAGSAVTTTVSTPVITGLLPTTLVLGGQPSIAVPVSGASATATRVQAPRAAYSQNQIATLRNTNPSNSIIYSSTPVSVTATATGVSHTYTVNNPLNRTVDDVLSELALGISQLTGAVMTADTGYYVGTEARASLRLTFTPISSDVDNWVYSFVGMPHATTIYFLTGVYGANPPLSQISTATFTFTPGQQNSVTLTAFGTTVSGLTTDMPAFVAVVASTLHTQATVSGVYPFNGQCIIYVTGAIGVEFTLSATIASNVTVPSGISTLKAARVTAKRRYVDLGATVEYATVPWPTTSIPQATGGGAPLPSDVLFAVNAEYNTANDLGQYGLQATITGGSVSIQSSGSRTSDAYIANTNGNTGVDARVNYYPTAPWLSAWSAATAATLEFDIYVNQVDNSGASFMQLMYGWGTVNTHSAGTWRASINLLTHSVTQETPNLDLDRWYHIAVVGSAATRQLRLYVDGVQVAIDPAVPANGFMFETYAFSALSLLQVHDANGTGSLNGRMDNVVITLTEKYLANFTPPSTGVTGVTPLGLNSSIWFAVNANNDYKDLSRNAFSVARQNNITRPTSGSRTGDAYISVTNADAELDYAAPLTELNGLNFTLEFDIYVATTGTDGYFMGATGGLYSYLTLDSPTTASVSFNGWTPTNSTVGTAPFSRGAWHHIALVADWTPTQAWRVYVDGILSGTAAMPGAPNYNGMVTQPTDYLGLVSIGNWTAGSLYAPTALRLDNVIITKAAKYNSAFTPGTTFNDLVGYTPPPSGADVTLAGYNDIDAITGAGTFNTQLTQPDAFFFSVATLDDATTAGGAYTLDGNSANFNGSRTLANATCTGTFVRGTPLNFDSTVTLDDTAAGSTFYADLPVEWTGGSTLQDDTSFGVSATLAPSNFTGEATLDDVICSDSATDVAVLPTANAVISLPPLTVVISGGGGVYAALPTLLVEASATAHAPRGVDTTLPMLTATAQGGHRLVATLPILTASAQATTTQLLTARVALPSLTALITGRVAGQAGAQSFLPAMSATAWGGHQAQVQLPGVSATAHVVSGVVARVDGKLPSITAYATGYRQDTMRVEVSLPAFIKTNSGTTAITLPQITVTSSAQPSLTNAYEAYVLNMNQPLDDNPRNNFEAKVEQVTRYTNWPFIQVVRLGTTYYGVAADGLYELGGETDNGTAIAWSFETCKTDFKDPHKKTVASAYVAGQSSADVAYTLRSGDDADRMYDYATTRVTQKRNHRQKFGLGRRVRYYSFGLAGEGKAAIDSIEFELTTTTRRV